MLGFLFSNMYTAFFILILLNRYTVEFTNKKLLWLTLYVGVLLKVVIHEVAHALMGIVFGHHLVGFIWGINKTVTRFNDLDLHSPGYALIVLAGPLANLMMFGIFCLIADLCKNKSWKAVMAALASLNFAGFCYNLIPCIPNDGFRILLSLNQTWGNYVWQHLNNEAYNLFMLIGSIALIIPDCLLIYIGFKFAYGKE